MLLLARSGAYHPQDCIDMFSRLQKASGDKGGLVSTLQSYGSTHPCSERRLAAAKAVLPEALALMQQANAAEHLKSSKPQKELEPARKHDSGHMLMPSQSLAPTSA
eukprot:TRINITY_DN4011_c0_g1_i1.p4 TRINITY_DN4011_c0_g1~~TRINITY_DN4011_c0_g1_i1.p4  ORF type:complete len:106 (-),score=30.08 TRINITY_DN4011_c0_g1_i1:728-1045(-)